MAATLVPDEPHALYRFYGAGGTLLYIGITNSIPVRLKNHSRDKPWWTGVTNITVEHYPNRTAVLEAERRAIIAERPLYNDKHNSGGLARIAAATEAPASAEVPADDDERRFWTEAYYRIAFFVLDSFPPEQVERYKRRARELVADGDPEILATSLDAAGLLGPAANVAFQDVYDLLQDVVRATEHLYRALPDELRATIAAGYKDKIERDGIRDLPRLVLEHLTDHLILNGDLVAC